MNPTSAFIPANVVAFAVVALVATVQARSSVLRGGPVRTLAAPSHLAHSFARLDPGWWRGTTPTTSAQPPLLMPGNATNQTGAAVAALEEEQCTPFVRMTGTFVANVEYWQTACKAVPLTATYIKLKAGDVSDYFKPKLGKSFCDMLTSSDQHLWSNGASPWLSPLTAGAGLGGSGEGWLTSLKLSNDKRTSPSFWGIKEPATATGGCCYSNYEGTGKAWGVPFEMSYCGMPQELAPICTPLVSVAGSFSADKAFWAETCKPIPMTATYIKINMGTVVDYFKPPTGTDYCEMLGANDKHKWSADGETWVDPTYVDAAGADKGGLGGSAAPGAATDTRTKVSFWGSDVPSDTGGCCYGAPSDGLPGFGKAFIMSHCEVPRPVPVNQLVELLHANEASVQALENQLHNLSFRLAGAEKVNVDASGNISLAQSGVFKLAVKAKDEADSLGLVTKKASLFSSSLDTVKTQLEAAAKQVQKASGTATATAAIAKKVATPAGLQAQEDLNSKIWKLMDPENKDALSKTEARVKTMEKDADKFIKELGQQVKTVLVTKMRREAGKLRKAVHNLGTVGNKGSGGSMGAVESSAPLGADLGLNDDD